MPRERHIVISRTARYYTLGPEDGSAPELWFVLHGYGQLAARFIRVFEPLDDGKRLIVAPEALSRFYLVGVDSIPAADRPVGATWMTREDRDCEINDYVGYLDALAREVLTPFHGRGAAPSIVVFAFSQGAATASRWITRGSMRPSQVVLWGGFPPPEIDLTSRNPLRDSPLHFVVGTRDQFVTAERVSEEERRLRAASLPYRLIRYDGGHGIAKETLREVAAGLTGVA